MRILDEVELAVRAASVMKEDDALRRDRYRHLVRPPANRLPVGIRKLRVRPTLMLKLSGGHLSSRPLR